MREGYALSGTATRRKWLIILCRQFYVTAEDAFILARHRRWIAMQNRNLANIGKTILHLLDNLIC